MQASDQDPAEAARRLLAWYDRHARTLPWRSPPEAAPPEPYRVWLSEVMLQQTTVAAVIPRFRRFVERWPSVEALAAAEDAEVMGEWAGLGYYRRARSLVACARVVAERGGFPTSEAELRGLPGIGAYTAAAIAAIAFGARAVVVDANVERVVARLFRIGEPLPAARRAIHAAAERLTPDRRSGDFAQAVMDLGATVCTMRTPRCAACPLRSGCRAVAAGDPQRYPAKRPRVEKPQRRGRAFWIERAGAVWLIQREATGLLGGMRALPADRWSAREDGDGKLPYAAQWRSAGSIHHVFTHFRLNLEVMVARIEDAAGLAGGEWWPVERLDEAGLPTVFAKAARLVVGKSEVLPLLAPGTADEHKVLA